MSTPTARSLQLLRNLSLTIPGTPPSGNHYVKHTRTGRHYRTREAEAWDWNVAAMANGQQVRGKSYRVTAQYWFAPGQRGDGHNLDKVLFDSLQHCGVIDTDVKIIQWEGFKFRAEEPSSTRTVVTVEVLP